AFSTPRPSARYLSARVSALPPTAPPHHPHSRHPSRPRPQSRKILSDVPSHITETRRDLHTFRRTLNERLLQHCMPIDLRAADAGDLHRNGSTITTSCSARFRYW